MPVTTDHIPPVLAAELARQYDILRPLGKGGMGTVWLARERSLDRLIAIKVLSGETVERDDVRERFRREARIAAQLMHPSIVPLHAFGETDDALYLVMGYVEGETLAARLEREGRVPRQAMVRILAEIADALAFAHQEDVVHRDVKPDNILIQEKTNRARLADFGVARAEDMITAVTSAGMTVGTPSYMSPEQAAGTRDIDGRSDVYSLAVVGYRMLAGRLPFTGASLQALLAQHAVTKNAAGSVGACDAATARRGWGDDFDGKQQLAHDIVRRAKVPRRHREQAGLQDSPGSSLTSSGDRYTFPTFVLRKHSRRPTRARNQILVAPMRAGASRAR